MPYYLPYLNYKEFEELAESLIVLPVGSIEQHCNAPLGTDALIVEAIVFRACLLLESRGIRCVILPALYYGFSPEWAESPGTITLSLETLTRFVKDIVSSLVKHGVTSLAIVNGHGGNSGLLESVSREVAREYGITIGLFDYWRVSGIRLGHCDDIEADLLENLLGLNMECSCREKAELLPYRIARSLPPSTGLDGSPSPGVSVIIYKLARALEDFYRTGRKRVAL